MPYVDNVLTLQNAPGSEHYIIIYNLKLKKEVQRYCVCEINMPGNKINGDVSEVKTSSGLDGFLVSILGGANGDHVNYYGRDVSLYSTLSDISKIKIGEFFPLNEQGCFVLQNKESGEIYNFSEPDEYINPATLSIITGEKFVHKISTAMVNPKLLYVDEADKVYIGTIKDNKITKIECNSLKATNIAPKKYILKEPVKASNIMFLQDGSIYDIEKGQIKNLKNNKITKFSGELIQIQVDKIFYKKGNFVIEKDMN